MLVVSPLNTSAKKTSLPNHLTTLSTVQILSSLLGNQIPPHEKRVEHAELPAERPLPMVL